MSLWAYLVNNHAKIRFITGLMSLVFCCIPALSWSLGFVSKQAYIYGLMFTAPFFVLMVVSTYASQHTKSDPN